jgi:hypothetical protein
MKKLVATLIAASTLAVAMPAIAQPYGDARHQGGWGQGSGNLEGLRVDDAKNSLRASGYSHARNINVGGRQYDLWSNTRSRDACVGFTSYNGRVSDVRAFDDAECGVAGGGWGRFDASDLRGMRVDDAKRNLRDHGYDHARNVRIDNQQWDLWESARGRGECVGFTSYNGKITGVRDFRRGECDSDWNAGNPGGGAWISPDRLRGLSVDAAKRELSDAGLRKARNINLGGKQWDLWYDDRGRDGRCIGFTSYNSRVTDARNFSDRDCY